MQYGYQKEINLPFDKAIEKTKKALSEKGFGILTEVNVILTSF